MTEPRILLATSDAGYEQRVRQAFNSDLNGELRRFDLTTDGRTAADVVRKLAATLDVVAIGPGLSTEQALAVAQQLEIERPEISVVLVAEPSAELWQSALRAGVRDVLNPRASDDEVRAAFDRALMLTARRRHNLLGDPAETRRGGRIITVLAPKGGSGKTTVASNIAVALASGNPNDVVLVDLDLQFGDVATALRLTPEHTIVDAARGAGPLDPMALKTLLAPHVTDLWTLCGSDEPARAEEVTAERAKVVVEALAQEFPYVVVDTSAGLSEHTLSILEVTTDMVFICAMDVSSVRSLRKEIVALDMLGMTEQRRHFVVNRADSKVGIDIKDVEATVGLPVDCAIPSSRSVPLSMNRGTPVVESDPRNSVARQLSKLAQRFQDEPARRSSGLLTRITGDTR